MIALGRRSIKYLMLRYCLLFLPVLLSSCGSHDSNNTESKTDSSSTSQPGTPPRGDYYKRYSGTIAGKQVVAQLHCLDGRLHGSYQYSTIGQVIGLRPWMDTAEDDEYVLSETAPGGQDEGAAWTIRIKPDGATGAWRNHDAAQEFPVRLAETYPAGSVALDAFYIRDSVILLPQKPHSPKALSTYSYLLPKGKSEGFLFEALRRQLVPGSAGADVATAIRAANDDYFESYRKENAALLKDPDGDVFSFDYSNDVSVSVLYNDQYWLVTELFTASYTGGAHGNYGTSYANIDLQEGRVWTASDIIIDTNAIRPMLNDAAINYFRPKPGQEMSQRLLVDEVPATANVYLSATGLSFVYNPYEIASYAAGQISLFLPYKKLMPFLTPAFKARMHLTERAGIAMLSY